MLRKIVFAGCFLVSGVAWSSNECSFGHDVRSKIRSSYNKDATGAHGTWSNPSLRRYRSRVRGHFWGGSAYNDYGGGYIWGGYSYAGYAYTIGIGGLPCGWIANYSSDFYRSPEYNGAYPGR